MPNLFSLPNWLILLPLMVYYYVIKGEERVNLKYIVLFFCLIGFDQLNFIIFGSVIEPVKAVIMMTLMTYFLRFKFPKIGTNEKIFLFWLIFRDLISFIALQSDALYAARYSLQLYLMYYGIFATTALLLMLYSHNSLIDSAINGICIALFICTAIACYQNIAFKYGLPINGIRNAYTEAHGGDLKWAAYSVDNLVHFRPYAFMGEPKFLGGFAIISYAFLLFAYFQNLISKRTLILQCSLVITILLLTASTSAFVSFCLVNSSILISSKRGWLIIIAAVLLIVSILYIMTTYYGFDFNALFESRIKDRLFNRDSALENHELMFLKTLLSSPVNLIFGLGHSVFADTAYKGFRTIPNGLIVYFGVNGGLILIFLYIMSILKSFNRFKQMSVFVASGLVYTTMTTYFVLFILASIAYNYLVNSNADENCYQLPDNMFIPNL